MLLKCFFMGKVVAMNRFWIKLCLCLGLLLCGSVGVHAEAVLNGDGINLGTSQLGHDVTDPENRITGTNYAQYATWTYVMSSHKAFDSGNEAPYQLFCNGTGKWFDTGAPSDASPAYVMVSFPSAFVLSHFAIQVGNDNQGNSGRNPKVWSIQGSNDGGKSWTDIYAADASAQKLTTTSNAVTLFTSFSSTDLANNTGSVANLPTAAVTNLSGNTKIGGTTFDASYSVPEAYSSYRFFCSESYGEGIQLSEWELFGYKTGESSVQYKTTSGNDSVFANASIHLNASNADSLTLDADGSVSRWRHDSQLKGFSQVEAASQPHFLAADSEGALTINGKTFDSVAFTKESAATRGGDFLVSESWDTVKTLFIVCDSDATAYLGGLFGANSTDDGLRLKSGTTQWEGTNSMGGTILYNGSSAVLNVNDPHLVTLTLNTAKSASYALGSYFVNAEHGNRPFNGKVAEVLAFGADMNELEQKLTYTYFKDKYGLDIDSSLLFTTAEIPEGFGNTFLFGNLSNERNTNVGAGGFGLASLTENVTLLSPYDLFTVNEALTGYKILASSLSDADGWQAFLKVMETPDTPEETEVTLTFDLAELGMTDLLGWGAGTEMLLMYRAKQDDIFEFTPYRALLDEQGLLQITMPLADVRDGYYTVGMLPEPSAWVLLTLALTGGFWVRHRKCPGK